MDRKRAYQTNMKQRFDRCKTPMGSVPISVIMGFDYPLGVKCLVKPKYRSNENLVTRVRLGDERPRRAPPPPPLHRPRQPQQVAQHRLHEREHVGQVTSRAAAGQQRNNSGGQVTQDPDHVALQPGHRSQEPWGDGGAGLGPGHAQGHRQGGHGDQPGQSGPGAVGVIMVTH